MSYQEYPGGMPCPMSGEADEELTGPFAAYLRSLANGDKPTVLYAGQPFSTQALAEIIEGPANQIRADHMEMLRSMARKLNVDSLGYLEGELTSQATVL